MVVRPERICNRCDTSLNERGTCPNADCQSNHPTWRPSQSGQRPMVSAASGDTILKPALCAQCLKEFDPNSPTCTHCGAPRSVSGTYRAVVRRGPGVPRVPAEAKPMDAQGFEEEPPTKPGVPRAIKKTQRPPER